MGGAGSVEGRGAANDVPFDYSELSDSVASVQFDPLPTEDSTSSGDPGSNQQRNSIVGIGVALLIGGIFSSYKTYRTRGMGWLISAVCCITIGFATAAWGIWKNRSSSD